MNMLKLATAFRKFNNSNWSTFACIGTGICIGFMPFPYFWVCMAAFLLLYGFGGNYLIDYYYANTNSDDWRKQK